MATTQDVCFALELFEQNRPYKTLEEMKEQGAFAVIKLLHSEQRDLSSAEICKRLGISSARVAVLIKKLESKNFIEKIPSESDSRVKMIALSQKGRGFAEKAKKRMFETAEKIVDEFGIPRLLSMFEDLKKIKAIYEQNLPCDMEKLYD